MQHIRHLRALARHMGIPLAELIRRRARKVAVSAMADSTGTIRLKPVVHCDRDLDGWQQIPQTVLRTVHS